LISDEQNEIHIRNMHNEHAGDVDDRRLKNSTILIRKIMHQLKGTGMQNAWRARLACIPVDDRWLIG
jgi:hypothetical protein